MAIRVTADFPGGNVCQPQVQRSGDVPEILFAAHPKGGTSALWFRWQITDTSSVRQADGKVRVTLRGLEEWMEPSMAADLLPVYRPAGQGWHRCSSGTVATEPDGRFRVSWSIPYPDPETEVALCFPYGKPELDSLRSKSRGYWTEDLIGTTEEGNELTRWSSHYGGLDHRKNGLYLIAREHAGESPASWVLDGVLQHIARIKRDPFLVWAIPIADPDALERGVHGASLYPLDVDRAWGEPPGRREARLIQDDIQRWKNRCKPVLLVDFHAAGPHEREGVYCRLPDPNSFPEQYQAAEKWANVIKQELQPDFAADDFKRPQMHSVPPPLCTLADYACGHLKLCALSICIPFSRIGTKALSQKNYREIGDAIAKAMIHKVGK